MSYTELKELVDRLIMDAVIFGACDEALEDTKQVKLEKTRASLLEKLFELTEK